MADEAGGQGQFAASRRNVELKATDPFPERSLAVCRELGAEEDRGALHQRDTYSGFRAGDSRSARRPTGRGSSPTTDPTPASLVRAATA